MKQLRIVDCGLWITECRLPVGCLLGLLICASAVGTNVNGNGASLNLSTTDLSSGMAQTNGSGGRLVSGGTPDMGVVSANGAGAKLIIEPMNAIAGNSAPVAGFSGSPVTGNVPLDVQFTDASAGGLYTIDAWSWDFGDGTTTSSDQNPKHTYTTAGTYDVTLTISTTGGSVSKTRNAYISATQGVPVSGEPGLMALAVALGVAGVLAMWRTGMEQGTRRSSGQY